MRNATTLLLESLAGEERDGVVSDVVLPQMGLEVSEGTVTAVLVTVGQKVAEGETVVEVETDKAIAEVPATRGGFVTGVDVTAGDVIPVGAVLVRIGDSADEAPAADSSAGPVAEDPAPTGVVSTETSNGTGRRRAAPIARRVARENGLQLEGIAGTGPGGRITLGDVEKVLAATPASAPASDGGGEARVEPLSATRQSIARRLSESQLVPAYNLNREIDATWLLAEKKRISEAGPAKVGVVDLLLQAMAEAISRHPILAASFVPATDDAPAQLQHPEGVDLGLAVATDRGLLVPVLRRVHERSLAELALERARLIEVTRAGRLGLADMSGAAATLSSLGTFGVDSFNAMLNPGESSILAVGRTVEKAVPRDRGIAVVPTLSLTWTFDHRVVDGAAGAAALVELADLLEGAMQWRT